MDHDDTVDDEFGTMTLDSEDDISTYDLLARGPEPEEGPVGEGEGSASPPPAGAVDAHQKMAAIGGAADQERDAVARVGTADTPTAPPVAGLAVLAARPGEELDFLIQVRVLPGTLLAPRVLVNISVPGKAAHLRCLDLADTEADEAGVPIGRLGEALETAFAEFVLERTAAAARQEAARAAAEEKRKAEALAKRQQATALRKADEARKREESALAELRQAAAKLGITLPQAAATMTTPGDPPSPGHAGNAVRVLPDEGAAPSTSRAGQESTPKVDQLRLFG